MTMLDRYDGLYNASNRYFGKIALLFIVFQNCILCGNNHLLDIVSLYGYLLVDYQS
jgi:hypothetical protein